MKFISMEKKFPLYFLLNFLSIEQRTKKGKSWILVKLQTHHLLKELNIKGDIKKRGTRGGEGLHEVKKDKI